MELLATSSTPLIAALMLQPLPPNQPPYETPIESTEAAPPTPRSDEAPKPGFKPINHEEDYSSFRDIRDSNTWTKLKYIPLGDDSYASLGGELRLRGEYRGGERYGQMPQDENGNFQMRARLWGDVHLGGFLRFFVDLEHAQSWGLDSVVAPIDQGKLDFNQAFVEARVPVGQGRITARLGRQEMILGNGMTFDAREGTNNRRSHDALRVLGKFGNWDGGLFAGYALRENQGYFDDVRNKDFRFRGAHLAHQWGSGADSLRLEGIYISSDRPGLVFNNLQPGHDDRHTLSVRAVAFKDNWSLELERQQQWGDYGRYDIDANFTGAILAHSWQQGWKPRLAVRLDRGSGDKNPLDNKAGAFAPLFPRPATYNGDLGYLNISKIQPMISVFPTERLKLDALVAGLWRTQRQDGVYALSGHLIFDSDLSDERYFGTRYSLSGQYSLNPFTTLGFYTNYTDVTRNLVGGKDLFYAVSYVTFRF